MQIYSAAQRGSPDWSEMRHWYTDPLSYCLRGEFWKQIEFHRDAGRKAWSSPWQPRAVSETTPVGPSAVKPAFWIANVIPSAWDSLN